MWTLIVEKRDSGNMAVVGPFLSKEAATRWATRLNGERAWVRKMKDKKDAAKTLPKKKTKTLKQRLAAEPYWT